MSMRLGPIGALLVLAAFGAPVCANATGPTPPGTVAGHRLADLVQAYFRTATARERVALAASVEEEAGGAFSAVAEVVRGVNFWSAPAAHHGTLLLEGDRMGEVVETAYHLPNDYDPKHRYPLLFCQPDDRASHAQTLKRALRTFGDSLSGFVLVCPKHAVDGSFARPSGTREDLPRLLQSLRRRLHVDSDRVFLYGSGAGGDSVWITALMQTDLFAGAVIRSGYPRVPYPNQTLPFLLENVRPLRVLTTWANGLDANATARQRLVESYNRAILGFAATDSLPIIGVDPTEQGAPPAATFAAAAAQILAGRRPSPQRTVSHWFRYPEQGRAGWLRQVKPREPVWKADQLSILPAPTTDRDDFVTRVVQRKLARLAGRIEGANVVVEVERCARVDLLLPYELLDWSQPISVRCNGRVRHEGLIRPSIQTMLETAYDEWEFQHPVAVRLSFAVRPREPGS